VYKDAKTFLTRIINGVFSKILAAIDGSESSMAAVYYAIDIVQKNKAELIVLNVHSSLARYALNVLDFGSIKPPFEDDHASKDRARYDLENREVRILEVEYLIPIAKQLQQMGTDINQFLPWVESVHEKAQAENLPTLTQAAYSLAQDLRMNRQLGGLKKNIQLTTQQLELLDMSLQKQQQAVMTLVNLRSAGISESEIVELIRLANQWGKCWGGISVEQRNGSGGNTNMNGSISSSGGIANGFKFKLDNRLNV
jgi:nucleotide-binding universal stress UspA family protein